MRAAAERQQWVDQLLASGPELSHLAQTYDFSITGGPHGDAGPTNLAREVAFSDTIAVVRGVSEQLDHEWSGFRNPGLRDGKYFGVAGRSQLTVEEMVRGDVADMAPYLTLPLFIAANSQCKPVVALGGTVPIMRPPVFQGERAVVFVGQRSSSTRELRAVVPIGPGREVCPGISSSLYPKPCMTGQEFIDAVRALIAAKPVASVAEPYYQGQLLIQDNPFIGRNIGGSARLIRSSPGESPDNVVGYVQVGELVDIQGEVLNGAELEPGQGHLWYIVGPNQYIYAPVRVFWLQFERLD